MIRYVYVPHRRRWDDYNLHHRAPYVYESCVYYGYKLHHKVSLHFPSHLDSQLYSYKY